MKQFSYFVFCVVFTALLIGCDSSDPSANTPQQEGSAGFGTFSQGYRMGQLSKFSVKGIAVKSGEGQLLMGREGTPYVIVSTDSEGNETKKTINPWYFSAPSSKQNEVSQYAGEYVWVSYNQAHIQNPLQYDTDYLLTSIQPVSREYPDVSCEMEEPSGAKSDGFRVGRIVKISQKGTVAKSFEAMIQIGNAGNQFKNMSVESAEMFNCAVSFLKSGMKVKIFYNESLLRNPLNRDTSYYIWKISPLEDI